MHACTSRRLDLDASSTHARTYVMLLPPPANLVRVVVSDPYGSVIVRVCVCVEDEDCFLHWHPFWFEFRFQIKRKA
jgi:hypothetical protein